MNKEAAPAGASGGQESVASSGPTLHRDSTQPSRRVQIRLGDGRVIGEVVGDVFHKRVRGSAHFLHTPRAIAFDFVSLDEAERAGARYAQVEDVETGKVYRAAIATIRARGFGVNRGHGRQVALPLSEWRLGDEPLAAQLVLPL